MLYSEETINRVRESADVVDIISQYVSLKRAGSGYKGLCPFHSEKTPSFSVSRSRQMFHCFGCGASGNVFTFLMQYENFSFPEAVAYLGERAGIELPKMDESKEARQKSEKKARLLGAYKESARYFAACLRDDSGKKGMDYFINRQLSVDTINKFGLGYARVYSDDLFLYLKSKGYDDELLKESGLVRYSGQDKGQDYFWNRVMFPIMDINNKVIAFGGRVMGDGKPKYLNSPETLIFEKKRNMYGLNYARRTKRGYMLLCEGYMDVIALFQAGFDNAVASLGTALTSQHAVLLKRYTDRVYITYDSDSAGVGAALRAIPMLKDAGLSVKVVDMSPYKDPDEFIKNLGADEYEKRIDSAQLGFYFEIQVAKQKYDMEDPEQKTNFQIEVAKKLLQFPDELERENYLKAVSEKYSIPEDGLRQLMFKYGVKMPSMEERRLRESSERNKKRERKDSAKDTEALLLTWLTEDVTLFEKLKNWLGPEDFTKEPYKKVAELLFTQYREQGRVDPARILNHFEALEEQSLVGEILNTTSAVTGQDRELSEEEKEKMINQNLKRLLINRLEEDKGSLKSQEELTRLLKKKKEIEKLYVKI